MSAPQILLIEDDSSINEPLAKALIRAGYQVDTAIDGLVGLRQALGGRYDLVLLDVGLPGLDGLEVCQRIKAQSPHLPVLMLTARTEEIDAVLGLDSGADDYIAKPFRLAELLARIRTALRRVAPTSLDAPGVRIDVSGRRAFHTDAAGAERELTLSVKEFDLLTALVSRAGQVVSRDLLFREVWHTSWIGSTKTLDQHVSWLRAKLGDSAAEPRYITTVRGVGFRFTAPDPSAHR